MKSLIADKLAPAVVLGGSLVASCLGQPGRRLESPPERSIVTIVHVKPEMLSDWLRLQKTAVVPALKKAGVKARTVYGSGVFGEAFEYTIIEPLERFSDFDTPEAQAEAYGSAGEPALAERLRRCVTSTASFLSTALPDLSNPGEMKSPPIVGFLRLKVVPGKMEQYVSTYRETVLPALKKAGSYVTVASRRLGTDGLDLTFETPYARFADLDSPPPLLRAIGPQEAARLTAELNAFATVVENTILIRQADLSF